ncbi:MAG: hypothetical protein WKF45_11575 [Ilumatobacteraceae bacterium]
MLAPGSAIAEGTAADITGNQDVIDAYLGAHHGVDIGAMGRRSDRGAGHRSRRSEALEKME